MSTTTTYTGVRIVDMPDLGAVTDDSSMVGEHAGSGRFAATAVRSYVANAVATAAAGNVGRNLIHNPLMTVAQFGAGPFAVNGRTLDRWSLAINTDSATVTQTALIDADRAGIGDEAARYALNIVFTGSATATAFTILQQKVEGVRRTGGKTVTVSFWATAAPGILKLGINATQAFGTGGSPSANAQALATGNALTLGVGWQRYSTTIAMPSTIGKTTGTNSDDATALQFFFSSGANTNSAAGNIGVQSGAVRLWGVQCEVGPTATPLEQPDPRYDLSNCQRFASIAAVNIRVLAASAQPMSAPLYLPAWMRATPTANPYVVGSRLNVGSVTATMTNQSGGRINCVSAAGGDAYILDEQWIFTADL